MALGALAPAQPPKPLPRPGFPVPGRPGGRPPTRSRPPFGGGRRADRVPPVQADRPEGLGLEEELCARARGGDREALGTLLRTHGPRLYRSVLLPRLGSPAAAEEALSATYLRVVERFGQFAWQSVGVYPWLRMVALRIALDALRARKRELLFEPADLERELEAAESDPRDGDLLEQHDLAVAREKVERVLNRIHPRYALAIRLRVIEERSRDDVAAELGVSVATGDVVLHRALAALHKALAAAGDPDP